MKYNAILYNQVFCGHCSFPSVSIFARFYADPIISYVKTAVINQTVLARFDIESIAILREPWIPDSNIPDSKIFAHQGVDTPCRGILENWTVKKYFLTFNKTYHNGTEKVPYFLIIIKTGKLFRYIHFAHILSFHVRFRRVPYFTILIYNSARFQKFLPLSFSKLFFFNRPPCFTRTVKNSFSCNSNIFKSLSING